MDGVVIAPATLSDNMAIQWMAHAIWWPTYQDYIPRKQIQLMLEKMYTEEALVQQQAEGQRFSLALRHGEPVGFVAFRPKESNPETMRIEKLYVLVTEQGKGTGKLFITHVTEVAISLGMCSLELNVNRNNPAVAYYQRQGFAVAEEVDIPYHGYILNDFVMRKVL